MTEKTKGAPRPTTGDTRTVDFNLFKQYAVPTPKQYQRMAFHQGINRFMGGIVDDRWVDFLSRLLDVCSFDNTPENEELMGIILTPLVGGSPTEDVIDLYLNVILTMVEMDEVLHITSREGGAS